MTAARLQMKLSASLESETDASSEKRANQVANNSQILTHKSNVQCNTTTETKAFQQPLKLPKFDRTGAAESFIAQFRNCASFNQWNEETQLAG